jgi:hypothetical protein
MNHYIKKALACGAAAAAVTLTGMQEAEAAVTSLDLTMSVCPGGALIPVIADRPFFDVGGGVWNALHCASTIKDTGNPSAFHWARYSPPMAPGAPGGGATNMTFSLTSLGSSTRTVCSTIYTYSASGAFHVAASVPCNNWVPAPTCASAPGPHPCLNEVPVSTTVAIPTHGSVLIDVAGQNSTEIRRISIRYFMITTT